MAEASNDIDALERRRDKFGQFLYVNIRLCFPSAALRNLRVDAMSINLFLPSHSDLIPGKKVTTKAN
jgi:hypothetical protein